MEPVTKKSEFADDEEIQALQSQLEEVKKAKIKALKDKYDELKKAKAEKEKEERLKALKEEIESEIIALGAKPVTQNSEFADDANIQALGKQLEQLRIEAESKKAAEKLEPIIALSKLDECEIGPEEFSKLSELDSKIGIITGTNNIVGSLAVSSENIITQYLKENC